MSHSAQTSATGLPTGFTRGRILLVDDYAPIRDAVRKFLERRGFDIYEADGGAEAISKMPSLKPDVVVMDLDMPGMNGVETASAIHQNQPRLPIIALTMYEQFFAPTLNSAVGVTAIISKTDGLDKLVECVESLLSGSGPHASAS
jgi:DNA-binding NarL/FixJ family response regulator